MSFRVLDAGDAALTIEFGSVIDPALLAAVNALDAAIGRLQQAGALPGVIETMPTFRSLTVFFDPLATDRDTLLGALQPLIDAAEHGTPVGLTALPERVRDARDGWPAVPELVGATAAADMLKVSRQQVWNLIEGGSLPGQRVGRDWVIPAAAVRALVEKRSAGA